MKYLYASLVICWIFGIGLNASYKLPTSKVNPQQKLFEQKGVVEQTFGHIELHRSIDLNELQIYILNN